MKKKIQLPIYYLSIIVLYLVGSPHLFAQSGGKLSVESFIQQATTIGSNEVAMGKLGLKRAQNEKVKTYAEQLVGDHTTINADLSALAKTKNIKIPDTMGSPINSMQTRIDTALESSKVKQVDTNLKNEDLATGSTVADFDSQYLQTAINDHGKAIVLYNSGAKQQDPDVQTFCLKYLPVLKRHLEEAISLSRVKN